MTCLEAIKAKISYPLSDNAFIDALSDRGLTSSAVKTVSDKRAIDLTYADLLYIVMASPNISEGGTSFSTSEKSSLKEIANSIYRRYGEGSPVKPTATFVQRW
jgi:hypothetical protein